MSNINDLEIRYLQDNGATSDHVNDAWMEVFLLNGATSTNFNTAAMQFLIVQGFTGDNLTDGWHWFWDENGGVIKTVFVSDSMSDIDGTLLTAHTPDIDLIGGGWSQYFVAGSGNTTIQSNVARAAVGPNEVVHWIDTGQSDVVITGSGRHTQTSQSIIGATFRVTDSGNRWQFLHDWGSQTLVLAQWTAGGFNFVDNTAKTLIVNTWYAFTVTLSGTSISCSLDSTPLSTTSSLHQSATRHGFMTRDSSETDDFTVIT